MKAQWGRGEYYGVAWNKRKDLIAAAKTQWRSEEPPFFFIESDKKNSPAEPGPSQVHPLVPSSPTASSSENACE